MREMIKKMGEELERINNPLNWEGDAANKYREIEAGTIAGQILRYQVETCGSYYEGIEDDELEIFKAADVAYYYGTLDWSAVPRINVSPDDHFPEYLAERIKIRDAK